MVRAPPIPPKGHPWPEISVNARLKKENFKLKNQFFQAAESIPALLHSKRWRGTIVGADYLWNGLPGCPEKMLRRRLKRTGSHGFHDAWAVD